MERKRNMPSPVAQSNILIVDDHPENLTLLRKMLTERGYRVRPTLDGETALESVHTRLPDLILLDIMMPPGLDGYEVCRQLKADERTRDIPVLFLSALDRTTDITKAFELGGVDYITKPFRTEEVLTRVETHLTLRMMQKQLSEQNRQLQQEIAERERAEEALQRQNSQLVSLNSELAAAKKRLESTNEELKQALAEVKKLSGLLPICASCKKIRDDNGYWTQIEAYIREHSEAEFSHSICPECAKKLYPHFYKDDADRPGE